MKKYLIFVYCLFVWFCLGSTSAFAQNCPLGTHPVINPKTNEVLCYLTDDAVRSNTQYSDPDLKIREAISASGTEISFGLGYGMVGAMDLHLSAGYHFNIPKADCVSFGLYTDFNIRFPYPNSLDWALVPMMHVHGDIFRVSFGLGIGLFSFFSNNNDDEWDDDDHYKPVSFQLKPGLRFDWFLSEHVLIGLNTEMPLIFYKYKRERYWVDENNRGHEKTTKENRIQPWFNRTFHVGYKF